MAVKKKCRDILRVSAKNHSTSDITTEKNTLLKKKRKKNGNKCLKLVEFHLTIQFVLDPEIHLQSEHEVNVLCTSTTTIIPYLTTNT